MTTTDQIEIRDVLERIEAAMAELLRRARTSTTTTPAEVQVPGNLPSVTSSALGDAIRAEDGTRGLCPCPTPLFTVCGDVLAGWADRADALTFTRDERDREYDELTQRMDEVAVERDRLAAAFDDLTESWRHSRRIHAAIQLATRARAEHAEAERDAWRRHAIARGYPQDAAP